MEQTRSPRPDRNVPASPVPASSGPVQNAPAPNAIASIYLEHGADCQECHFSELKLSERGMEFKSRWQFQVGTQLELVFAYRNAFGRMVKAPIEGIVVDCEPAPGEGYVHLLIFPEMTPELRESIRCLHHGRQSSRAISLN